jgi:hypothetical protein
VPQAWKERAETETENKRVTGAEAVYPQGRKDQRSPGGALERESKKEWKSDDQSSREEKKRRVDLRDEKGGLGASDWGLGFRGVERNCSETEEGLSVLY